MDDSPRDQLLPKGAPNPLVWCERCQRIHRYHTFTQEDYDNVIAEAAQGLADAIDAVLAKELYDALSGSPQK